MKIGFETIDAWIRGGDLARARAALQAMRCEANETAKVRYAALLRRVGLSKDALAVLHSTLHGTPRKPATPSVEAKIEYAANLARLGSTNEALKWLAGVDGAQFPEALLVKASVLVANWNYADALPLYRAYLTHVKQGYGRLVARVNLASALVHEGDLLKASQLLEELGQELLRGKHRLLYTVVLQLKAQLLIGAGKLEAAVHFVDKTLADWVSPESREGVLLKKWRAIATARLAESGTEATPDCVSALRSTREQARALFMYETVRDCERWEAILSNNRDLAAKVYFGTPSPSYKEGMRKRWPGGGLPSSQFTWSQEPDSSALPTLDLETALADASVGEVTRRALAALTADLYRPIALIEMHEAIFPGEYFNPESSPGRVRQAISRLRRWLVTQNLPLEISHTDSGYQLIPPARLIIRFVEQRQVAAREEGLREIVAQKFLGRWFSVGEIVDSLPVPRRTVQRRLQELVQSGAIEARGSGRGASYRLRD